VDRQTDDRVDMRHADVKIVASAIIASNCLY